MSEPLREWRVVDSEGVPHDFGAECWPIYENEDDAIDALHLAIDDRYDEDESFRLEVREVTPWVDTAQGQEGAR